MFGTLVSNGSYSFDEVTGKQLRKLARAAEALAKAASQAADEIKRTTRTSNPHKMMRRSVREIVGIELEIVWYSFYCTENIDSSSLDSYSDKLSKLTAVLNGVKHSVKHRSKKLIIRTIADSFCRLYEQRREDKKTLELKKMETTLATLLSELLHEHAVTVEVPWYWKLDEEDKTALGYDIERMSLTLIYSPLKYLQYRGLVSAGDSSTGGAAGGAGGSSTLTPKTKSWASVARRS